MRFTKSQEIIKTSEQLIDEIEMYWGEFGLQDHLEILEERLGDNISDEDKALLDSLMKKSVRIDEINKELEEITGHKRDIRGIRGSFEIKKPDNECPKCGESLFETGNGYEWKYMPCSCGFLGQVNK